MFSPLTVSAASRLTVRPVRLRLLSRFIFSRDTIPLRRRRLAAVAKSEGQSRGVTGGVVSYTARRRGAAAAVFRDRCRGLEAVRDVAGGRTRFSLPSSLEIVFFLNISSFLPLQRCSSRVCLPRLAPHHFLLMTFSRPCCSLSCCVSLISLRELLSCLTRLSRDCCGPGLRKAHRIPSFDGYTLCSTLWR